MLDDFCIVRLDSGDELLAVSSLALGTRSSADDLRRTLRRIQPSARALSDLLDRMTGRGLQHVDGDVLEHAADQLAARGVVLLVKSRGLHTGRLRRSPSADFDDPNIPRLADLGPPPPPPPPPEHEIDVLLFTDDGAAIVGAQLELRNDRGFATRCVSDARGRLRVAVPIDSSYRLRLLADILLPPPPETPAVRTGVALGRLENSSVQVAVSRPATLVVARPRARVVAVDRWIEACPVLLFGVMAETPDGPSTVRGALRRVLTEAGAGQLHFVGHADTEGKAADNEALALERARSMHLFLAGDRQAWAEHAFAHADVATLQGALAWAASAAAVPCDPGGVDGDWGPKTAAALNALRDHGGVPRSQPLGADDWASIFDLFDQDLARLMLVDRAGLAAARARLVLAAPSTMGERWPAVAPELGDFECPENRRVDLVMCAPGTEPAPGRDELYDGTFECVHLPVPPEVRVRLMAWRTSGEVVPHARFQLHLATLGTRQLAADGFGALSLLVLRGDRVRVAAVTDARGNGRAIAAVLPEATA